MPLPGGTRGKCARFSNFASGSPKQIELLILLVCKLLGSFTHNRLVVFCSSIWANLYASTYMEDEGFRSVFLQLQVYPSRHGSCNFASHILWEPPVPFHDWSPGKDFLGTATLPRVWEIWTFGGWQESRRPRRRAGSRRCPQTPRRAPGRGMCPAPRPSKSRSERM